MREEYNEFAIVDFKTSKSQFVPVYFDLLDCPGNLVNGEEKIVYIILCRFWNENKNYAYPSISKIMSKTGWGNKKVIKVIDNLEKKRLLEKQKDLFSSLQNNKYILYDIELITDANSKKKWLYDSIKLQIKIAQDDIKNESNDFLDNTYMPLSNFIDELYKKEKVTVGKENKLIKVVDLFEKLAKVHPTKLLNVIDRVDNRASKGELKNKTKYLITALYESAFTEAGFNSTT